MIIGNINSYSKNLYTNNSNYKQLQKVHNSNNKAADIVNKNVNQKPEDITKQKMKNINTQLMLIENSEQQIQSGMSVLQEKEVGLNKINDIGNQLKELSEQYKKSDLSEKDKSEIEKKAEELLNNLGNLMNYNKKEENNIVGDKLIELTGSDSKTDVILSKGIDITLDFGKVDDTKINNTKDDKHFSSNVSVKTLLENASIIKERILTPVQTAIEKVHDSKSIVYGKFIKEYTSAKDSIDELFKIGGISAYQKDIKMRHQNLAYIAVSELYSQPSKV